MTKTGSRPIRMLCLSGVATLILGACAGTSTTTTGTSLAADQSLKMPLLGEVDTLDPALTDAETDQELNQNMFDGLVTDDTNLNVVPDIAAKMPDVSSDGLTYTFTLRQDVSFWNGDKVTSKDVLYSFNRDAALQGGSAYFLSSIVGYARVAKNTTGGAALEKLLEAKDPSVWMTGMSAPDDYTVKIQLASPAGWFVPALASPGQIGDIVDQNAIKQNPDNWWSDPATAVGTGPYKLTSRVPKVSMDFAAVPNWWGSPRPTLQKVHLDILPDASTAVAKYEQGGYDVYGFGGYSSAPLADLLRIQGTPAEKSQLKIQPKVRTTWVTFNMTNDSARLGHGPFTLQGGPSAHDLRLAFDLAVDKQQLVKVVCGSGLLCAQDTGGIITPGLFGYLGKDADPLAKFDPAQAKQLLKQGDPDGSKTSNLTYYYDSNNDPLFIASATYLQDQWQTNLGVHVNLQAVTHETFMQARGGGAYPFARGGWLADYNSPEDWYDGGFGKNAGCPDSSTCVSGYINPAFDALAAKANVLGTDQALPIYKQMAQMLIDDVVYIPLMYHNSAVLIKPYVEGAGRNAFYDYNWNYWKILSH